MSWQSAHSLRHLVTFSGTLDHAAFMSSSKLQYVLCAPTASAVGGTIYLRMHVRTRRNQLCSLIDAYNTQQLRDGKSRICVTAIDSRDAPKKPPSDPDAMLALFFQAAADSHIVVLGNVAALSENCETQRCLRKVAEHEARLLADSLANISRMHAQTLRALRLESAVLKSRIAELADAKPPVASATAACLESQTRLMSENAQARKHSDTVTQKYMETVDRTLDLMQKLDAANSTIALLTEQQKQLQEKNAKITERNNKSSHKIGQITKIINTARRDAGGDEQTLLQCTQRITQWLGDVATNHYDVGYA